MAVKTVHSTTSDGGNNSDNNDVIGNVCGTQQLDTRTTIHY